MVEKLSYSLSKSMMPVTQMVFWSVYNLRQELLHDSIMQIVKGRVTGCKIIATWGTVGYLVGEKTGHLTDEMESILHECTRFCEALF